MEQVGAARSRFNRWLSEILLREQSGCCQGPTRQQPLVAHVADHEHNHLRHLEHRMGSPLGRQQVAAEANFSTAS